MKVTPKVSPNANPMGSAAEAAKSAKASGTEGLLDTKSKKASNVSGADLGSSSKVELSTRAQDIKRAKEIATASPGIDEAKVARLQALIDKGQYKVNAEKVAEKLLDEHSKMPE
ncbi:MAG: flagellar biosynthesis anti-sigma factor FlgM [Bdellovibrionota bacterium]